MPSPNLNSVAIQFGDGIIDWWQHFEWLELWACTVKWYYGRTNTVCEIASKTSYWSREQPRAQSVQYNKWNQWLTNEQTKWRLIGRFRPKFLNVLCWVPIFRQYFRKQLKINEIESKNLNTPSSRVRFSNRQSLIPLMACHVIQWKQTGCNVVQQDAAQRNNR